MSEHLAAILKLLEHCSDDECTEIMQACITQMRGKLTHHDTREADPVPYGPDDWRRAALDYWNIRPLTESDKPNG